MQQQNPTSGRINVDPDNAEQGLAQLVLTVVELLRQIVERHAMRRVEGGTLTDEQVENLGIALMNLEEKMEELKDVFGLDAEDLNIDLGPLGNLL
ncbi:gas vesicle protein K [Bacillus sp. RAR_GA_16]|uniref:gas vesicle protein K n=1 Tax=Bacillus sp. RAR_GA_16 TaxID=2876774 RepID=UPI001CCF3C16|nr:gas vesicle protein K [Bacillus sp. RAR_GA_16]MCA0170431.1 gas vesicle protein K [Bacillus sp. RAR_GA_16]